MQRSILTGLSISVIVLPSVASAHGIGEVYALPVPLSYYLAGAAVAVASSLVFVSILMRADATETTAQPSSHAWLALFLRITRWLAVIVLGVMIAAGFTGDVADSEFFTPLLFWVYFLVGMSIASVIVGNIWEHVSPFRTISGWVNSTDQEASRRITPWIGVVLLLALYWWELVLGSGYIPQVVALVLTLYVAINFVMPALFRNWFQEGEVFSVLFGTIGNIAPFRIGADGASIVRIRPFRTIRPVPPHGVVIAGVLLAETSFDSIKETLLWFDTIGRLGLASLPLDVSETIGLLLTLVPFMASFLLAMAWTRSLSKTEIAIGKLAGIFGRTLLPIAFGYTLAHNLPLFIVSLPRMFAHLSDPFGIGWDIFGTASFRATELLLGARTIWFIEIGLVVAAHVTGILAAHRTALALFKDRRVALRAHYPLTVLMVGYTVATLWLLSQPLVVPGR